MRKFTILATVLIALTITVKAQIPNSGFEDWTKVGNYENPSGVWLTTNSYSSTSFYAVTKTTDHYPANVGNYAVKIANNISLLPSPAGIGIFQTNTSLAKGKPMFPISGHPNSFCGYYKFNQQNNDTMRIVIALFKNGSVVSSGIMDIHASVTNWTSFSIPLPTYTTADSGFILMASYIAEPPPTMPHGNSELFVDNLSFDNLVTGIEDNSNIKHYQVYPNPANEIITVDITNQNADDLTLNIYNAIGKLVISEKLGQNQQHINTGNLDNGIYMLEIRSKEWTEKQKIIVHR